MFDVTILSTYTFNFAWMSNISYSLQSFYYPVIRTWDRQRQKQILKNKETDK